MNDPVSCNLEALRSNEAWLRPLLRSLVGDNAADDVLQETWLRAWQRPPRVAAATGAWLARVATRLALSHRRSEARRQRHEGAIDGAATAEATQITVERLALQRAVSLAVAELPEPHRTALLLHHYHGLDVTTIAARTSTSAANVRQRLHRARQWLRERLARDLGGAWRRAPAIVALLAPPPSAIPPAAAATAMPLLLTMNKARFVVASLVACALLGGALLAPQWLDSTTAPASPEPPRLLAVAPPATGDAVQGANDVPARREMVAAPQPTAAARHGTVLDSTATPVAGVELGVLAAAPTGAAPFATSDAAGRFPVPAVWPRQIPGVAATTPWVVLAVRPPADGAVPVEARVVVCPGRRQVVRVVDREGQSLRGTSASVKSYQLADFPLPLEDTVEATWKEIGTGGDGHHEWLQLPVGKTVITVRKAGFAPVTLPVDATTPADVVATLHPLASGSRAVSGVVTDARGAYVTNAKVGLGRWRTTTGAFGEYVLHFEAGARIGADEALFAAAPDWVPARVDRFGAELAAPEATSLTRDLQLTQPALAIRGRVLGHGGEPCSGVRVYPWELQLLSDEETAEDLASPADAAPLSLAGNEIRAFATTGDDGAFVLRGLGPRAYRLRVYDQKVGWAWTSPEVAAGTDGALLQLPDDPMGPVAGRALGRDGRPATGVRITANVEIHAGGGGRVSVPVPGSAEVDEHGRFRIDRLPRLGTTLHAGGEEWINGQIELDGRQPFEALELTMLRRCHVRIECTGAAWADARIDFFDAAGERLMISERRRSTEICRVTMELHEGRTGVLAVSEAAVTLVLRTRDGKREQRLPVVLRPGEVTAIVNSVQ